jgi:hypothetical protein
MIIIIIHNCNKIMISVYCAVVVKFDQGAVKFMYLIKKITEDYLDVSKDMTWTGT